MTHGHFHGPSTHHVSPSAPRDGGCGTEDEPFGSLDRALELAGPGSTILLHEGSYTGDFTVHKSGTITEPIRIAARTPGAAIVEGGSWYLYDVSDIILEGIAFRNTKAQALSVVGACARNAFNALAFTDCGRNSSSGCTLFFGGSGVTATVVADCRFEISRRPEAGQELPIALMIAEGDLEEDAEPNTALIVKGSRFLNYGSAMVIGTQGGSATPFGHIFEGNTIEHCGADGMRVKCGDSRIYDNLFLSCLGTAIALREGAASAVECNRIEDCATGIASAVTGATIRNNCILRSSGPAISLSGGTAGTRGTLVATNTCVAESDTPAIAIDGPAECVAEGNILLHGGAPLTISQPDARYHHFTVGNAVPAALAGGSMLPWHGIFNGAMTGDYTSETEFGAAGWNAAGRTIVVASAEAMDADEGEPIEGEDGEPAAEGEELSSPERYERSMFFGIDGLDEAGFESDEDEDMGEDETLEAGIGEDGIRDYSDWDE